MSRATRRRSIQTNGRRVHTSRSPAERQRSKAATARDRAADVPVCGSRSGTTQGPAVVDPCRGRRPARTVPEGIARRNGPAAACHGQRRRHAHRACPASPRWTRWRPSTRSTTGSTRRVTGSSPVASRRPARPPSSTTEARRRCSATTVPGTSGQPSRKRILHRAGLIHRPRPGRHVHRDHRDQLRRRRRRPGPDRIRTPGAGYLPPAADGLHCECCGSWSVPTRTQPVSAQGLRDEDRTVIPATTSPPSQARW